LTSIPHSLYALVMDEKSLDVDPSIENTVPQKDDTFISKLKINFKLSLPPFVQNIIIPVVVIVIVIMVGGGGTYLIASNVLGTNTESSNVSKISDTDIPVVPSKAVSKINPTPTPTHVPEKNPAGTTPIPTPTISEVTQSWTPYTFSAVNMTFKYPLGWFVNLGTASGAPYLFIQNFSGSVDPSSYKTGEYAVYVFRLEQTGITSVTNLTTQLAVNAASSTYINGVNYGQVTVKSSTTMTINGYQALRQNVSYSQFPSITFIQTYILDGVSNVIGFMPMLDATYGQPYFDLIFSTVQFTN
jgi:hypothetical protein